MKRFRILVVEDEKPMAEVLVAMLAEQGHVAEMVANGDQALAAQAREPYDIVVMDLFMPGREGLETIREFRSHHRQTKVIAISGGSPRAVLASTDYLEMAHRFGAAATLAKPFTAAQLAAAIEAVTATGSPPAPACSA